MTLLYKDESYKIIGAAMNVHRELGCGFLEAVYHEALAIELKNQNIPCTQKQLLNFGTESLEHKRLVRL